MPNARPDPRSTRARSRSRRRAPLSTSRSPPRASSRRWPKQTSLNDLSRMVGVSLRARVRSRTSMSSGSPAASWSSSASSVVRKVAWDVVPEMAERLVRERLAELERAD